MTILIANPLLEQLKLRQTSECMSGRQFAKKLGVSHQLWQKTRTGELDIGLVLLKATAKAYPVLKPEVFAVLAGQDYDATPPQTTRDSLFRRLWRRLIGSR